MNTEFFLKKLNCLKHQAKLRGLRLGVNWGVKNVHGKYVIDKTNIFALSILIEGEKAKRDAYSICATKFGVKYEIIESFVRGANGFNEHGYVNNKACDIAFQIGKDYMQSVYQ